MKVLEGVGSLALLGSLGVGIFIYSNGLDITNPAVRSCITHMNWIDLDPNCKAANSESYNSPQGAEYYQAIIDVTRHQPIQLQIQEPNFRSCREGPYC